MLLLVLFLFFSTAEARVPLIHSEIFDEYDFKVHSVPLWICDAGCRIYASIPKDHNNYPELNGIVIVDNNKPDEPLAFGCPRTPTEQIACSIVQIASMFETGAKNLKASRNLPAGNYSVQNRNGGFTTAPLVLYVIAERVRYFQNVYEVGAWPGQPYVMTDTLHMSVAATFMSVQPYTITSFKSSNGNSISVINAGFDAALHMSLDNCTVIHQSTGPLINYPIAIRSPISSLMFGSNTKFSITIAYGVDESDDISTTHSMVATSFGYSGCQSQQSYRSSLYPSHNNLRFQSPSPVSLSFSTYRHFPDNTFMQITTSSGENSEMSGQSGVALNWHLKTNVTWLNFAWAGNVDTFFAHIITAKGDENPARSSQVPPAQTTTKVAPLPTNSYTIPPSSNSYTIPPSPLTTETVQTTTKASPLHSLRAFSVIYVVVAFILL